VIPSSKGALHIFRGSLGGWASPLVLPQPTILVYIYVFIYFFYLLSFFMAGWLDLYIYVFIYFLLIIFLYGWLVGFIYLYVYFFLIMFICNYYLCLHVLSVFFCFFVFFVFAFFYMYIYILSLVKLCKFLTNPFNDCFLRTFTVYWLNKNLLTYLVQETMACIFFKLISPLGSLYF